MRLVLNIIWVLFAGIWLFLAYALVALACFILFFLIVTIPFGVAALRIGVFALWPFGRTIVPKPRAGIGSLIGNIIWIILFGWELAIAHIVTGILLCLTIIGIPLGLGNFKLIPISLFPFGAETVRTDRPLIPSG
jgi:uncharacterized membrane protein YccF (DUF307 family)